MDVVLELRPSSDELKLLHAMKNIGEEMTGLEIKQAAGTRGSVYEVIDDLRRRQWIESRWQEDAARTAGVLPRFLYRLTDLGREMAAAHPLPPPERPINRFLKQVQSAFGGMAPGA